MLAAAKTRSSRSQRPIPPRLAPAPRSAAVVPLVAANSDRRERPVRPPLIGTNAS